MIKSDYKFKKYDNKKYNEKTEKSNIINENKSNIMKPTTICILSNCYKIITQAAKRVGLVEVEEKHPWNLLWTDATLSVQQCRNLKRFQMVNYIPGIGEIARKDLLARNLSRMQKHFPKDYDFFPKTWWLPADLSDLLLHARIHKGETYIVKPGSGSQGKGIFLTKRANDLENSQQSICQVYIPKPYLIDGFKFDIRIYIVITSCDPLRIYTFNEGIVRFATQKYVEPQNENIQNVYMHLTNYSINKKHHDFIKGEKGSKRRLSSINEMLNSQGIDMVKLWNDIDSAVVKTILPAAAVLKHQYHLSFPRHPQACFILLGIDVLIDSNLKPYIIEVNRSPSLNIDSKIDEEVKEQLLVDTFSLLNLGRLDQQRVMDEERQRVYKRTHKTIELLTKKCNNFTGRNYEDNILNEIEAQILWEELHLGNFRKIYPADDFEYYDDFFIHNCDNSLFQDTTASKVRKELNLQQKAENDESEETSDSDDTSTDDELFNKTKLVVRGRIALINSFEPQYISMAEERERLRALDKRDTLLRVVNLRSYVEALLNSKSENIDSNKDNQTEGTTPLQLLQVRAMAAPRSTKKDKSKIRLLLEPSNSSSIINVADLKIESFEAPLAVRPMPSRLSRWTSLSQLQFWYQP